MGVFQPRPDQWEKLNAIGSTCKYTWSNQKCHCALMDISTKNVWHGGTGRTAHAALDNALETAGAKAAPKTSAEIAEENMNQTQKIADLESKLENLKEGDGSSKPTQFMEDASIDSGRKKKKRRRRSPATSTDTETETK
jgi:hypothetical protein